MSAQRLPSVDAPHGRPYVLLVEDETDDEALAQRILKKYRIANHIDWVKDGEDALKLLRERLSSGPAEGKSLGESSPVLTRSRPMEMGSSGASLMPSAEAAPRSADPGQGRPSDAKPGNGQGNGVQGRTAYRAPEMILLDYGQPKSSALDVIRRMRTLPGMDNVPIAVCCRTPEEEKVIREAALPRTSCLSKPIGFFKILECIQKMDMHWFVFSEKP